MELGRNFGNNIFQFEIDYLINSEWVFCWEDVVERRLRLKLFLTENELFGLREYIQNQLDSKELSRLALVRVQASGALTKTMQKGLF